MRLVITGASGFIGFHLAKRRLQQGDVVVGIDNLNDYYDVRLKQARLQQLQAFDNFIFHGDDVVDAETLQKRFAEHQPQRVIHLAAQAGVRYSLTNPGQYVQSNLVGFANVLEACRHQAIEHLVYASTSSVYGANSCQPYHEAHATNHPLTLYAASKKANELMAHSYSHLFQLPTTGLRFFTVYGPWGRPDMAFFSFTKNILEGKAIQIFNHGRMQRDFTYIDDIVAGISAAIDKPAVANPHWNSHAPDPASSNAPFKIYNIGCGAPVNLMDYIEAIEEATGKQALKEFLPMQNGDVLSTHADTHALVSDLGYQPQIHFREGVRRFVEWYQWFYR
ncbi:NAD-dependent epimerase/dehydratase family protein [Legionella sp. MW5194]|uniref:NAD-dependent epimerase n=1 Tax=Legionella sp. MW5194 TaxID=2662448 RepID=UPI00193D7B0F|nr:NAD-dependent epimerase [Legionella sp. MW5194]QRN04201.1 NAD-dependent epimerase/dehydratase family protein [Legionella sp. MW5194]